LVFASLIGWSGCAPKEQLPLETAELLMAPDAGLTAPDLPTDSEELSAGPQVEPSPISDQEWIDGSRLPWTYAEVHYLRGGRIGYSIMTVSRSEISEFKQLRIQRTDVIDRAADGTQIPRREVTYEAFERPNGELASFRFASTVDGLSELEVEGRMIFDEIDITRREQDAGQQRRKIAWPKGTWGPMGVQAILMRSPMQPGQVRESQSYLPQLAQFVKIRLEALEYELTPIAGRSVPELLKIDVQIGTPESGVRSQIWTDRQGVIQKTATLSGDPILRIRVEENIVRRLADQSRYGRLLQKEIELTGDLASLQNQNPLTIEVQSIELDPFAKFLQSSRQELSSLSAGTCQIRTGSLASSSPTTVDSAESELHLDSSAIIPSGSSAMAEMAAQLLGDVPIESTEQTAALLREQLQRNWSLQPNGAEIQSTLAAARTRSGGSLECAAVLTALLRQQQIPARMVGGLLIDAGSGKARFHVWTQAWIDGQWTDWDAVSLEPVGTLHLAMATTAASGDNPYEAWLPILEVIQEILDIRVK